MAIGMLHFVLGEGCKGLLIDVRGQFLSERRQMTTNITITQAVIRIIECHIIITTVKSSVLGF